LDTLNKFSIESISTLLQTVSDFFTKEAEAKKKSLKS